tara:strand:- start:263 stop:1090 length:828 start_codon:yes stop_codon:yes gene_type:complete
LDAYLDRIGLDTRPAIDEEGLRAIHRAQYFSIPFENLDIHLGRRYSFDTHHLVTKMISRKRGGFCYELNLLLAAALRGLGFEVDVMEGRMRKREGGFGRPFDHMTLRVAIEGNHWLADVGNGETFQQPLPWDGSWTPQERGGEYRVILREEEALENEQPADLEQNWKVQFRPNQEAEEEVVYNFRSARTTAKDFLPMLTFHTTSKKSQFTKGWIVTRPLEEGGRITAARGLLMTTRDGKMERQAIRCASELEHILAEDFNMLPVAVPPSWFNRRS